MYSPSSCWLGRIRSSSRWNVNVSSVIVVTKCLATLCRLMTFPTRQARSRRAPVILWSDAVACSAVSNGPEYLPLSREILHAFPKRCVHAAVDERLRRHDDSALLFLDIEVVAGFEPETVVQLLGDHDLAAHAQLDGSPKRVRIVFSYICILQLARASVNGVPHQGPRRPEAVTPSVRLRPFPRAPSAPPAGDPPAPPGDHESGPAASRGLGMAACCCTSQSIAA